MLEQAGNFFERIYSDLGTAAALLRGRVGGGGARGCETAFRLCLRVILPRGEEGRREGGRDGERNLLRALARVHVHVPAVAAVAAVPDGLAIPLADGLAVAVGCGHHSLTLARSLAHSRTQGRHWRLSSLESQQARCVGSRW